jgi:hypothetical protein
MAQYPDVLGWWPLNEGEGTVAVDISGNGNDGTLEGSPEWIDDPARGTVLSFSGSPDHVDTPVTIPAMTLENSFTWLFWCKQVGDGGGANMVVLGNRYGGSTAPLQFIKFTPTRFEYYSDAHVGTIDYVDIPAEEWVHMATVMDRDSLIHYRNGVEAESNTATVAVAENPFSMGGDATNGAEYWTGSLSDVALFMGALTEGQIQDIMAGKGLTPELPTSPLPADATADVPPAATLSWNPGAYAASHDVYLGTDMAEVDAATPADAAYMGNQQETLYDPEHLVLGQTYYWRVDEVNAAPDNTVFKGPIWSFTVEPVSYVVPMDAVSVTASSTTEGQDPNNIIDGTGLNENGEHSNLQEHMWLAADSDPNPVLQFDFAKLMKLDKVHVWNHNTQTETILGFGIKEAKVEITEDGETWTEWGTAEFAQATGQSTYTGADVALNGVMAKSVRLTALSNYSILGLPQKGLSEVRFYYIPVRAREPEPADGGASDGPNVVLQWRAGREAAEHEVVFSDDRQAVIDNSAVAGTTSDASYDLGTLVLGMPYYWKINEVNEAGTPPFYEGDLWTFQVPDHVMIDDFEMYQAKEGSRIWEYWFDGFEDQANNGAVVGNGDDAEKSIVYEGGQSMPIAFNNTVAPASEVIRFFDAPVDLTVGEAESLKLQIRGDAPGFIDNGDGTLTVGAAGVDIWNTADDFRFVYKRLSGDGSITARIDSCSQANVWTKAGIMIRENLSADSTNSYSFVTPTGRVGTQWREETFGATVSTRSETEGEIALPYWVRLTRTGSLFTGAQSADGVNWQPMFQSGSPDLPSERDIAMIPDVHIGLAVTSHQTGESVVAIFSEVTTTGNVTGPWMSEAIGADTHPDNQAAPMYLVLADTAGKEVTIDHPDPAATVLVDWDEWTIPLSELGGINTAKLDAITVGIGSSGVQGKVFVDAIRTYKAAAANGD